MSRPTIRLMVNASWHAASRHAEACLVDGRPFNAAVVPMTFMIYAARHKISSYQYFRFDAQAGDMPIYVGARR